MNVRAKFNDNPSNRFLDISVWPRSGRSTDQRTDQHDIVIPGATLLALLKNIILLTLQLLMTWGE